MTEEKISKEDIKKVDNVQKNWLILLFISPILILLYYYYFNENFLKPILIASGYISNSLENKFLVDFFNTLKLVNKNLLNGIYESVIAIPIMYYFSYKKFGVKLLSISIFFSYLRIVFFAIGIIYYFFAYERYVHLEITKGSSAITTWGKSYVIFFAFICFIEIFLNIFRISFSSKLKKFNFQKKIDNLMSNECYKNIFVNFEDINQIDELNTYYSECIKKNPEIEKYLTKIYKNKKKELDKDSKNTYLKK